jgi:hypothetical protein
MKIGNLIVALLPFVAGCLTSAPSAPTYWTIARPSGAGAAPATAAAFPAAKLFSVEVRAPYNGTRLAVLRADGSMAFDPFNHFAAQPAALLRGAAFDVLSASGAFERVVAPGSTAAAPVTLEVTVVRLALDCRRSGQRDASVALVLTGVGNRAVLDRTRAEAAVAVTDGNYSAAFSQAFSDALTSAVRALASRR